MVVVPRGTNGHLVPERSRDDGEVVARYLFTSHDGFGLGHVRRNTLVARALLDADPAAEVTIVTGLAVRPTWAGMSAMHVVQVPPLLKDSTGAYRTDEMTFEEAVERRTRVFDDIVAEFAPDVVVVDRHPYGVAGELRQGLDRAAAQGAGLVLGLRDILDEAGTVRRELAGAGWDGAADLYDRVLVYGERVLCDQEAEYGLPVTPHYCGWVVDRVEPGERDRRLLVVTGGGGGDGDDVYRLGIDVTELLPQMRTVLVAGPYTSSVLTERLAGERGGRVRVLRNTSDCAALMTRAGAVIQMAGYNSTLEALAAGVRPILVPRRAPRREQAIRAVRLAAMDVADVVDEQVSPEELSWLLARPRVLPPDALDAAGIRLDGAARAAAAIRELVPAVVESPRLGSGTAV
jgi:predicted glycosyltransferase